MASPLGAKVPSTRQLCGFCRNPVLKHNDAVEERTPGQPAKLFHAKKCWPKERRRRHKLRREEERRQRRLATATPLPDVIVEAIEAGMLYPPVARPRLEFFPNLVGVLERWSEMVEAGVTAEPEPELPPEPEPVSEKVVHLQRRKSERPVPPIMKDVTDPRKPSRAQGRRGLVVAIYEILDGIEAYFTKEQVLVELARRRLTTTLDTVGTSIWSYAKTHDRPYDRLRVRGRNVYRFRPPQGQPLPPEPEEFEPVVPTPEPEPVSPEPVPVEPPAMPVSEPEPVPVLEPVVVHPGLTLGEHVDRELNDFQAMIVDMISDLRRDLKSLVKERGK